MLFCPDDLWYLNRGFGLYMPSEPQRHMFEQRVSSDTLYLMPYIIRLNLVRLLTITITKIDHNDTTATPNIVHEIYK